MKQGLVQRILYWNKVRVKSVYLHKMLAIIFYMFRYYGNYDEIIVFSMDRQSETRRMTGEN